MKKIIKYILVLVLTLLFIPNVYAANNVEITDINLVDQSVDLIEVSPPKIDGMNLKFDLSFLNVGDYAKYKVEITNNSNKDFYLDNETKFSKSNYISYKYEFTENIDKIKANTKIIMYITIKYEKAVPVEKLVNGMYTEENAMSVELSDVILKNPNTYSNIIIIFLLFITLVIFTIVRINKKKKIGLNILLIGLLLIPISVYALERITIKAETKITIEEERNILESRYTDGIDNERDFWQYYEYIESVTFKTKIEEPSNYVYKFDVSEKKNNSIIAYLVPNEASNTYFDLYIMSNGYIYANPDSKYVFSEFEKLKEINNIEKYKTNYAVNMEKMFSEVDVLEKIDISSFNTENVIYMDSMFWQKFGSAGGNELKEIKLGNINTKNVKSMSQMFYGCGFLEKIDLNNLDTSNVTNMSYMFSFCRNLENIDVSSFDTSKVTNMSQMFSYLGYIKTLDLSNFDTTNVTNMNAMFLYDANLENIYVGNKWNVSNVTSSNNMFRDCRKLPNYDSTKEDKTNANTTATGYLTLKS